MQETDDAAVLATAIRAARAGGRVALDLLGQPQDLGWKGMRDPQIGSALAVQRAVLDEIHHDFPDHAVLAEESAERPHPDSDPLWIVDPIDGSLNYLQGLPLFTISIAFMSQGVYRVGVVYDPCRDELFRGVVRKGAWLNDEPIVVEQVGEAAEALEKAVIGMDWPREDVLRARGLRIGQVLATHALALNVMGSPSLGLCYLAAGRLHAYFHLDLELWDVAAAAVILHEAGGTLTDARGGSWLFSDHGYLATNGVLHGEMLRNILPELGGLPRRG